ncbi:hypothetical protein SASPL_133825 [Salvia splendens]|uniref:Kinesin-like protein n=1 Tax=Salvia splendens TaxID=180675 RepID=A0A8X8ZIQ6_SALSN|nr:hypothetical protein SASPL_133825 [Salvia splendens]
MSGIRVSALFRPLNSKEKTYHGDSINIRGIDSESFVFKDEKDEETEFRFDKVFFPGSEQADIYEFLALPIVKAAASGANGVVITYGQTGAGKTYSMEGPSIIQCDEKQKGLLPRVVDGIFKAIKSSDDIIKYTIKLSMVEIYMERVRDLFDRSKDNLQIKENKMQGIFVNGVTEISISDSAEALRTLSTGIANRAAGETRILILALNSGPCVHMLISYISQRSGFTPVLDTIAICYGSLYGKLILVDLAGSEKAEKTGAEGRVLEEAKSINRSLSALGNVINALSSPGRGSHIPYRDSKLTRILQDALGGNSQTALLCCCSPSPSNASETLSTLRFGARAQHIKQSAHFNVKEDEEETISPPAVSSTKNESMERILAKLAERMEPEDVQLLKQLFVLEGIFFDPNSVEEVESAYEDVTSRTISSLQKAVEELVATVDELKKENETLKALPQESYMLLNPTLFNMVNVDRV